MMVQPGGSVECGREQPCRVMSVHHLTSGEEGGRERLYEINDVRRHQLLTLQSQWSGRQQLSRVILKYREYLQLYSVEVKM